jgi:hypothetical protein
MIHGSLIGDVTAPVPKKKRKTFHVTVSAPTIIATIIAITITTTIKAPCVLRSKGLNV